jgi:RHS repeat-associated protein
MEYSLTPRGATRNPTIKNYSADGQIEIKNTGSNVEFVTYLAGDAYSSNIVVKSDGVSQNFLYLHRDYLGSIVAISNQAGNVVEKRHFDAWGSLKNLEQNGVVVNITATNIYDVNLLLDRGYTGHEHLFKAGLIHMNGRLYDPLMHRFLQPDNYVQDPSNTQNYNRYGYVLNNPLKYTDPSGEEFITAFIIAVVVSSFMYVSNELSAGRPVTLKGFTRNLFITAFSSAVTFGIGSGVSAISSNFFVQTAVAAVAHGAFQGGMSALFGGNFWSGFASGSISSVAASFAKGANGKHTGAGRNIKGFATSDFGVVAFGAISGGAGAALTGGCIWQGAVTGGIVAGLNHLMHDAVEEIQVKKMLRERISNAGLDPDARPIYTKEYLEKILNSGIEDLKEDWIKGGKPKMEWKNQGYDGLYEHTPNKCTFGKNLYSNYKLVSTMFHEFRHAWQYNSKTIANWRIKYNGGEEYLKEYDAYNYQMLKGDFDGSVVGMRDNYKKEFYKFIK